MDINKSITMYDNTINNKLFFALINTYEVRTLRAYTCIVS